MYAGRGGMRDAYASVRPAHAAGRTTRLASPRGHPRGSGGKPRRGIANAVAAGATSGTKTSPEASGGVVLQGSRGDRVHGSMVAGRREAAGRLAAAAGEGCRAGLRATDRDRGER